MSDFIMVEVDAGALRQVLTALMGPSHHVMELVATRNLPGSPIGILVEQFNEQVATHNAKTTRLQS